MPDKEQEKFFQMGADLSGVTRFPPGAWLRVSGQDAATFLQGQFTQELRPEKAARATYSLLLTAKGKMVADAWVLREDEAVFWIWSAGMPAAALRERLEAYVVADDVVIEDETAAVEGWVLAGEAGRATLCAAGFAVPARGEVAIGTAGRVFAGRRGVSEAWEWVRPRGLVGGPEESLPREVWEQARLAAGLPRVPAEVGLEDLPAEAGLDRVAIAYDKGCYLGQEVMARLRAMGRVRRQLARVQGSGPPPHGEEGRIVSADGVALGEVRGAVAVGDRWIGLAMVKFGAWATEPAGSWLLAREAKNRVCFHEADLASGGPKKDPSHG